MAKVPHEMKVDKRVDKRLTEGGVSPKQQQILRLLLDQNMTTSQIAQTQQISRQAVHKTIKLLQKKGLINASFQGGLTKQGVDTSPFKKVGGLTHTLVSDGTHKIRLHGQAWRIRILHKGGDWKKRIVKCNQVLIDSNTVMLHKDKILVYSGHSFLSDGVYGATEQSILYLQRLLIRLETEFNLVLLKNRSQNIYQFRAHYAEMGNELAVLQVKEKQPKIMIFAQDDGKLWFTIDNSFNMKEAETQHSQTAERDMAEVVQPFFNDLRDHRPPMLSEIMILIKQVVEVNKETAAGLNGIMNLLNPNGLRDLSRESVLEGRPDYIG
jgi:hypothetical protein